MAISFPSFQIPIVFGFGMLGTVLAASSSMLLERALDSMVKLVC